MSAYIIVDLTPTDPEKLQRYSTEAAETIASFGGQFLAKGPIEALHGEAAHKVKAIIEFPDNEAAVGWYNSDAYQALISLRNDGMESQFHLLG